MKQIEIESWAVRILERIEKQSPIEDSLVELKSEWPDPAKAARRIAGHANAARGDSILWLIGVDEKKGIVGANDQELSSWLSSVRKHFDDVAPAMQHLNVTFKGHTVAALCFDTTRAPYVVQNPAFGRGAGEPVQWEVPWREGNATRSASRIDLISILMPTSRIPRFEILEGTISAERISQSGKNHSLAFRVTIYVVPVDTLPVTFPFHRCMAAIIAGNQILAENIAITMESPGARHERIGRTLQYMRAAHTPNPSTFVEVQNGAERIEATTDEVLIRGPGKVEINGMAEVNTFEKWPELELRIALIEAVTDSKLLLTATMKIGLGERGSVWDYGNGKQ